MGGRRVRRAAGRAAPHTSPPPRPCPLRCPTASPQKKEEQQGRRKGARHCRSPPPLPAAAPLYHASRCPWLSSSAARRAYKQQRMAAAEPSPRGWMVVGAGRIEIKKRPSRHLPTAAALLAARRPPEAVSSEDEGTNVNLPQPRQRVTVASIQKREGSGYSTGSFCQCSSSSNSTAVVHPPLFFALPSQRTAYELHVVAESVLQ